MTVIGQSWLDSLLTNEASGFVILVVVAFWVLLCIAALLKFLSLLFLIPRHIKESRDYNHETARIFRKLERIADERQRERDAEYSS